VSQPESPRGPKGAPRAATSTTGAPREASPPDPSPPKDVVFVRGPTEDGRGVGIVRLREDRIETGELREAKEGQPIVGELVKLEQRPEHERLYDVEVLARGPAASAPRTDEARTHKGPLRVTSDSYRAGWDAVFGETDPKLSN
jgi:hypothetical protein